ncbi:MAG: APC family permease [Candidatus Hydrogenedentota bacterium]|nr:MAG: APC family permease [Candidatus Hydrogenedentota bacterium]
MSKTNEKISVLQAAIMGVNIMVGAGILASPGLMAAIAGGASFLGWSAAALILLPVVYNISRLPEAIPGHGGIYLYCKKGLGTFGGFAGGWLYFLSYNFAITAILSALRGAFLAANPNLWILRNKVAFFGLSLFSIFILNMLPASVFTRLNGVLTFVKLIPIFGAMALLPLFIKNGFNFAFNELMQVPKTVPIAIFGFCGFEYCCNLSHLVKGEPGAAKKSIIGGFLSTVAIYTLFHIGVLSIMNVEGLAKFKASGYASFVSKSFPIIGNILTLILPVATVVTFMNTANGVMFLDSLIMHSLAEDGMLRFERFFRSINTSGRPWVCTMIATLLSLVSGLIFESTQTLAVVCSLGITSLLVVATIALLKTEKDKPFGFNKLIAYLGILIGLGLVAFNWISIADDNTSRFISMLPMLVGMIMGILLYNPKPHPTDIDEMASEEALETELHK